MTKKKRRRIQSASSTLSFPKKFKTNAAQKDLIFTDYLITNEGLKNLDYPVEVDEQLPRLHEMVTQNPQRALERLKKLTERYPDVPVLYNYIFIASAYAGESDKLDQLTEENYRRHPRYLFAKINYAESCLRNELLENIPDIFENKFDLKLLYPERDRFHVSEAVSFFGTIGYYRFLKGEMEHAQVLSDLLNKLDPESESARRLRDELFQHNLNLLNQMIMGKEGRARHPLSTSSDPSESGLLMGGMHSIRSNKSHGKA